MTANFRLLKQPVLYSEKDVSEPWEQQLITIRQTALPKKVPPLIFHQFKSLQIVLSEKLLLTVIQVIYTATSMLHTFPYTNSGTLTSSNTENIIFVLKKLLKIITF